MRQVNYLQITDKAKRELVELVKNSGENCDGVRVSIKTRGCNGLEYDISFASLFDSNTGEGNITPKDEYIVLEDNIKLFIDPKCSLYIIGMKVDYEENDTDSGFKFINPNEKGRCGCGESFTV